LLKRNSCAAVGLEVISKRVVHIKQQQLFLAIGELYEAVVPIFFKGN